MAKRRSSYFDSYWPRYEPARPIKVEDGIKARSQRGKFVKNWWADRWIAALRPLMDSGRLSRGRSYARRGQVLEIDIAPGHITSRVQGSRRTPYEVRIQLEPLSESQWDKVLDALAEQAIFAAQLLNSEMPPDVEEIFQAVDVPLFPLTRDDLRTDCSCPDWANPCKHIAAVYYLLGERFDEDPFLLFELRGRTKEAIAASLRERRADDAAVAAEPAFRPPDLLEVIEPPALEECLNRYWALDAEAEGMAFDISPPAVDMALLKRLGVPNIKGIDERSLWQQMVRVYDGVSQRALEVAFADLEDPGATSG
jgi:uncharacterized Zn finger protein